jgi:hypothetical protein
MVGTVSASSWIASGPTVDISINTFGSMPFVTSRKACGFATIVIVTSASRAAWAGMSAMRGKPSALALVRFHTTTS